MLPSGTIRIVDFVDIFLFAVATYVVLLLTTRGASRRGVGVLLFLGLLYLVAKQWQLYLTLAIFEVGFFVVLIAIAVVYQDDIRRASDWVTQWISRSPGAVNAPSECAIKVAEVIGELVFTLAAQKIGALIVIRGRDDLSIHIDGGTELDALPSLPLLQSLFDPNTPGHDGAVIIDQGRISYFGTHLPLAKPDGRADDRGTRHHAALGMSDVSDALTIVVSEERGTVSYTKNRELKKVTLPRHLQTIVEDQLLGVTAREQQSQASQFLKERPALKLVSLAIAVLAWWLVVFDSNQIYRTFVVPIEYRKVPKSLPLGDNLVKDARVTLLGTENAFRFLVPSTLAISIDVSAIENGQRRFSVNESMVQVPNNLTVTGIEPRAITVIPARDAKRFPTPIGAGEP